MLNDRTHPQRITPAAPPGSLLKRTTPAHTKLKLREVTGRDPVYLSLVRQCMCLHCAQDPAGVAAHVRMQSGAHGKRSGMAQKPADRWCVPLCQEHHDLQHRIGEQQFWRDVGLNPLLVCERLYRQRGDLVSMRAVVVAAIGERKA
jgi:hypothetical protein